MKSCPECNRTFSDETLSFCLVDGAILSASFDPKATLVIPEPQRTEPPPTEVLKPEVTKPEIPPTIASPQPEQKPKELVSTIAAPAPSLESPQSKDLPVQLERRSKRSSWILGAIIMLIAIGGIIGIVISRKQAKELPTLAGQHAAKARELENQSKYKEAEQEYRQAVNLEPNNDNWHRELGGVLYVNKKLAEAEAELKEAIRLNPNYSDHYRLLSIILERQGKSEEAKAVGEKYLQLASNSNK